MKMWHEDDVVDADEHELMIKMMMMSLTREWGMICPWWWYWHWWWHWSSSVHADGDDDDDDDDDGDEDDDGGAVDADDAHEAHEDDGADDVMMAPFMLRMIFMNVTR